VLRAPEFFATMGGMPHSARSSAVKELPPRLRFYKKRVKGFTFIYLSIDYFLLKKRQKQAFFITKGH
jgi:hypothetical protein